MSPQPLRAVSGIAEMSSADRPSLRDQTRTPAIFIVDDDLVARQLINMTLDLLRLANPRVHSGDGNEVVEQLGRCVAGEVPIPALVMLDDSMPGLSGLEVLRWMRTQTALAGVPVVMLTGTSDVASIRGAYDAGAASYLVKPVAFEALADVLRGLDSPWMLL